MKPSVGKCGSVFPLDGDSCFPRSPCATTPTMIIEEASLPSTGAKGGPIRWPWMI